jgi:NADPH:quinone reductase-like Zn-dependent oxidoreductase
MGADVVIDKSTQDLWGEAKRAAPEGYDVVLDANGVETLAHSYAHLGSPGRLVIYGFSTMMSRGSDHPSWPKIVSGWLRTPRYNPLTLTNDNKSVLAFNLSYLFDRREIIVDLMQDLLAAVNAGKITAPKVTAFPIDKVADAHRAIESGSSVGKLVLTP